MCAVCSLLVVLIADSRIRASGASGSSVAIMVSPATVVCVAGVVEAHPCARSAAQLCTLEAIGGRGHAALWPRLSGWTFEG